MSVVTESAVRSALSRVEDPELNRSITDLGMVKSIDIDGSSVAVEIYPVSYTHLRAHET